MKQWSQQNCQHKSTVCSYWMSELSMEPKYAAPDSIWSRDKSCLETSTCCTSWRENDEHCMQQLAWWPHQKQSWPNAHASIPEFWGSKCPHLLLEDLEEGMSQSRNLQQCPASEVRSQLPADTFAETPRLHRTSATIDLRDSIWGWSKCQNMSKYVKICQNMSKYVKICQNQWFTLIYRYLSYSRDEWRSINQLLTHSHNKTGMMWRTASNTFFWLKRCQKAPRCTKGAT